ncbi:DUF2789 domain-containing protein [Vibrio cincinnatiensis]|uniref:DUF2789 domain-containing protein n=1 Tax=Vibrio cincinnatiensis DSM 19608 TaxID=1123491 RepID=A0A1T4MSP2_VIBCI|nr:DUF2789 domain-containing protein [Vibrio cincinnatiensis]MCG3722778.1 DUF2789 domain-containing protein [Vibrio cincinnatiensis]MCG3760286.1 DUF2789 domain-containing protein [Vibrio cincinnatiensis]MCG3763617.1 DUF2789 domain-containing protein [Vibrio cincinnatiensis]SJZ69856.1 Protein of unknown function [Vibrio cincinnatiensis DSM 19608]SUP47837.1 Protein of uncharacterised function (DUF2789) [Vibrio cincinnatiensis]
MELHYHRMSELFEQLGLGSSSNEIEYFIETHRHQRDSTPLYKANFWNDAQANFLRQAIEEDADWSELVDQLDVMLRK